MGQKLKISSECPGTAFCFKYENLYNPAQNLIRSSVSLDVTYIYTHMAVCNNKSFFSVLWICLLTSIDVLNESISPLVSQQLPQEFHL